MEKDKIVYRSKVDGFLVVLCVGTVLLCTVPVLVSCFSWWLAAFSVLLVVAIFTQFYTISYVVDGSSLVVRDMFSVKTYDIGMMRRIRHSRSALSAPAASLDRLEIKFSDGKILLVSPKRKQDFVDCLIHVNPGIYLS